jgi:hypothetical protein
VTPPRIAARVPDLPPDEVAALPRRRSTAVRRAGALAAAVAALMLEFARVPGHRDAQDAILALLSLAPWALALPWLRRLDLHPVHWFFLCLLLPVFPAVLAGKVAYRALSLPYRDWTVERWHSGRLRAVRDLGAVVLVGGSDRPLQAAGSREARWRTVTGGAWAAVLAWFVAAAVAAALDPSLPHPVRESWVLAVAVLGLAQLVGEFVLGLGEPRRPARPQSSSATTSAEE